MKRGARTLYIQSMNDLPAARNRALFLDRDGVINVDHGYVHTQDNFDFIEGIFDLVQAARVNGYRVVVITNQAGIARGYYSEEQFHKLTDWMCKQFCMYGTTIDKVYFSPYHPTLGIGDYRKNEDTRKPGSGMIFRAKREFNLSLEHSILIGDKASDIQAGFAAGVGLNVLYSDKIFSELADVPYVSVRVLQDVIPYLGASQASIT